VLALLAAICLSRVEPNSALGGAIPYLLDIGKSHCQKDRIVIYGFWQRNRGVSHQGREAACKCPRRNRYGDMSESGDRNALLDVLRCFGWAM